MFSNIEKELIIAKNAGLDKNKCTKDIYYEAEKSYLDAKYIWNNTNVCFETIEDNQDNCTHLTNLYDTIENKLNKAYAKLNYLNQLKNKSNCPKDN
jgi:hypothetical protein